MCQGYSLRRVALGHLLICVADLAPEVDIVLFLFGKDASLRSVPCNPSELFLPKARYLSASPDKTGGEDGTFNRLNGADGQVLVEIEIDGADPGLRGGELFRDFRWGSERLFNGGVQPPLLSMTHQRRTAHHKAIGQVTRERANLDPGPAGSGPDFEQNG